MWPQQRLLIKGEPLLDEELSSNEVSGCTRRLQFIHFNRVPARRSFIIVAIYLSEQCQ